MPRIAADLPSQAGRVNFHGLVLDIVGGAMTEANKLNPHLNGIDHNAALAFAGCVLMRLATETARSRGAKRAALAKLSLKAKQWADDFVRDALHG